jgi:hypothetical protein
MSLWEGIDEVDKQAIILKKEMSTSARRTLNKKSSLTKAR